MRIYDPLPAVPTLLHTFSVNIGDRRAALVDDFQSSWFAVNQIIVENDLLVAAVGGKVFAWKAGSAKKREAIKSDRKRPGGLRSGSRLNGLGESTVVFGPLISDKRSLHEDVVNERRDAKARVEEQQESKSGRQQRAAMEDMGLDADAALQYAMMLSMEDQGSSQRHSSQVSNHLAESHSEDEDEFDYDDMAAEARYDSRDENPIWQEEYGESYGDEDVDEAVRAVEEFRKKEEAEMREALEMIRIAEERERSGH